MNTNNQILVNSHFMEALKKKIVKINKKAEKFGCPPIGIEIESTKKHVYETESGHKLISTEHTINVTGVPVKMNGWVFAATIDWIGEERVIKTVPGFTVPKKYYVGDNYCEHCKSIRNRKNVWLVEHEDGRIMQIGSTCIKDFLGHDLRNMLGQIDLLFDEDFRGGGKYWESIALEDFLNVVSGVINTHGWVSGTEAWESNGLKESTADKAILYITYRGKERELLELIKDARNSVTDKDREQVKAAIAWASELDAEHRNDYMRNIGAIARAGEMNEKFKGFAASILGAYKRDLEYQAKQKLSKEDRAALKWVGEIDKREDFTVTIKSIHKMSNDFGVTCIHRMNDEQGNVLVWFASGSEYNWLEEGGTFDIKATVKKHDSFNGMKQTVINRVKCKEAV